MYMPHQFAAEAKCGEFGKDIGAKGVDAECEAGDCHKGYSGLGNKFNGGE